MERYGGDDLKNGIDGVRRGGYESSGNIETG